MSKSAISVKHTRVQKVCTLWTHDDNFSRDDVVFNGEKFPELPANPGALIQIIALKQVTAVRDFQNVAKTGAKDSGQTKMDDSAKETYSENHSKRSRRGSVRITLDEHGSVIPGERDVDLGKSYIFVAKALPADLKSKHPNLQISIAEKIAKEFGFRNRSQIVVTQADEERCSASHVEVTFRDEYLARADMWRMSISELSNRTVYRGQRLLFMGTIKAAIKNVYIDGRSTHSGYFSSTTKPVFRSESARYVLFIQMSQEMWDFDAEGAGEIMFNKVVNGFLPDLFKRWMKTSARHLVTIILFTRMTYEGDSFPDRSEEAIDNANTESLSPQFRDYYRVVVSDMASGNWINILYQLKKEFRAFLRDVSLVPRHAKKSSDTDEKSSTLSEGELVISGKPSPAAQGNILEAINLAAVTFAKDYIDRDLVRTGISVIVVTAGTGVFEVDYNMLKLTTDTLIGSGIGIDLVCLSPMPLHSVPLFKYRNPRLVSSLKNKASNGQVARTSNESGNDIEDRTPRQNQPNFGSIAHRSPILPPPPIFSSDPPIVPPDSSDEWRYAMPHWVDISFWSGPSDEVIELSKPKKSDKSVIKKKAGNFALRCRMYELQMMGVMENELGDISIPYMEEDQLYPHRLRAYMENAKEQRLILKERPRTDIAASGSYSSKGEKEYSNDEFDQSRSLHRGWMEAYDDTTFSSLNGRSPFMNDSSYTARLETSDKADLTDEFNTDSFSSSIKTLSASFGRTARPRPDTDIHQLMREQSRDVYSRSPGGGTHRFNDNKSQGSPRADVLLRQMSTRRSSELKRPAYHHQRGNSGDSNDYRRSVYSTPNDSPAVSRGNTPPKHSGVSTLQTLALPTSTKHEQTNRPGGWFLRQISFGVRGGTTAKPTTSTATIDITADQAKPARLSLEKNQKGAIAAKLASTKPTQPINIRAGSRAGTGSDNAPSETTLTTTKTLRDMQAAKTVVSSQSSSVTKDPGSTFLLAGSRALTESIGPKLDLSSSGGVRAIPRTLSPTSAIAPWAVLVNPCNPKKNNLSVSDQFRRWQHVFPKRLRTSSVKWKSLCSPAAVPLTNDYFPSAQQLTAEYNESPYKITRNDDDDTLESFKSRESLVRELIAFRLSHGFQIIIGASVAEFSGGREQELSSIFHSDYMSHDGDTVFMCVGNTIHQLVCVAGGEVEVKRFNRKPTTALQSSAGIDTPFPYKPFIRTALEADYHPRDVILRPQQKEYNWNFIDTFLAGYHDEFSEILRFWRARFVLIPVELPNVNRRPLPPLSEDSEEEVRLEGIRKLTQVWQRYRHIPLEERHFQAEATKKLKDPNPLAIEYHTREPSAIVAAGPDTALLTDVDSEFQTSLFSETEQYQTASIDLKKLSEDLQGDKGIRMLDRRWHWRLHYNCFLGFDLTSWLLSNFKDIETRDEAVDLGNQLMNRGMFQHVQRRHQFRDGNFFYQIAAEYRAPRPESRTGWFGMRRTDRSVPSTPLSEGPRMSPLTARSTKSRPGTSDSSSASGSSKDGEKTPTRASTPKRKVNLSRVMRYDVDPRKRSYRPEIISLHYDRLHNPDNCYHIRIDWMNVTAKLIEDAIVTWATSVEKYGLKLVEVPIAEASNIIDHHPFRSPYLIRLACQPPQAQPEVAWDTAHFSPQSRTDKFAYHKALLRKLNFVLDMEAASSFPSDVDVSYSWGDPDYKYTQFIHRSGLLLVQITNEGEFLLLANRLAHNRAKDTTKFRPIDPYEHKRSTATPTNPTTPAERANPHRSPFSSPLARPVQDSSLLHTALQEKASAATREATQTASMQQTPEQIKEELETFCSDVPALQSFYAEAFKQAPSPSPRIHPVLDNNIPNLGLPPAISIREASPAATPGWAGLGSAFTPATSGVGAATVAGIMGRRTGSDGSGSVSGSGSLPRRQDSQGSAGTGA